MDRKNLKLEIKKISQLVNLENDLYKKAKNLSGGMKKRLSLAMALIGDPKILILDEPSSGLDLNNRRILWDLLNNLKYNKTIILSTHYMDGKHRFD